MTADVQLDYSQSTQTNTMHQSKKSDHGHSKTMRKEDLVQFIMKKSQMCLGETNNPDQVEAYFFWQIMELFCRRNGNVMMCEFGEILLRGYGLLRQKASKLKDTGRHKDWCLPLACLLCSTDPDDKKREAVIKMGDHLASKELTFAAHLCYVMMKVELGSRAAFHLIGCKSIPCALKTFNIAIKRTETYEYALSLASGQPQLNFQILKLYNASRKATTKQYNVSLASCKTIARAVITSPSSVQLASLKRLIKLCSARLGDQGDTSMPDWLVELHRLHRTKLAKAVEKVQQEKHILCTSSEIQDSECDPISNQCQQSDLIAETNTMHQSQKPDNNAKFPGPLMSKTMQKEDLVQFIMKKSQMCLDETNNPNQVEAYFFWQIMELFCRHNGNVMMCEFGGILLRGYGLLRQKASKLKDTGRHKDWCLPLACLLCSTDPDDKKREAVIKMGDHLASKELTYAAHLCYVMMKVELGSRAAFHLIGCRSIPFATETLNKAVKRTETYEYVLSLASGQPQLSFQILKLCNASRIAMYTQYDVSLDYCKTIAGTVITSPSSFGLAFLKRLIKLCSAILVDQGAKSVPDWLVELHRLYCTKLAKADEKVQQEKHISYTSSEIQDLKCDPMPHQCLQSDLMALIESRYIMGDVLGNGGFGKVYAGLRKSDSKPIALKMVHRHAADTFITIPGEKESLPLEVALMKLVSQPPCSSNIINLLDWVITPVKIVMVLEWPSPCIDLEDYIKLQNGSLSEAQSRDIMRQVVHAARHCLDCGVFHRDIKMENILINIKTLQIKLIDFGCGDLLRDDYCTYSGTASFAPPEFWFKKLYNAIPATIWALGILLFYMVVGDFPFCLTEIFQDAHLTCPGVSQEFFDLLIWCLDLNPKVRPTFEELLSHEWFMR